VQGKARKKKKKKKRHAQQERWLRPPAVTVFGPPATDACMHAFNCFIASPTSHPSKQIMDEASRKRKERLEQLKKRKAESMGNGDQKDVR